MTTPHALSRQALMRGGSAWEYTTLAWNVVGTAVLAVAAVSARSVALAGLALETLIEIGGSAVMLRGLSGIGEHRRRGALQLIGIGFALVSLSTFVQAIVALIAGFHPHHSMLGIAWTAVTAPVMFALAAGKARTGAALDDPVLIAEGRVTRVDGFLAVTVLVGLVLTALGMGWADPVAGSAMVFILSAKNIRSPAITGPRLPPLSP